MILRRHEGPEFWIHEAEAFGIVDWRAGAGKVEETACFIDVKRWVGDEVHHQENLFGSAKPTGVIFEPQKCGTQK